MPFFIVRQDITTMHVDAIVNAANNTLLGGGGVDGCIHRAAGPELLKECASLGGCLTGEAKLTKGYDLPCKYIIHTVGPIWQGGTCGEEELLYSCYRNSLNLAKEQNCASVAFPLISAGAYGYPKDQAVGIAKNAIKNFLADNDMDVYLTIFGDPKEVIAGRKYSEISEWTESRQRNVYGSVNFSRAAFDRNVFDAKSQINPPGAQTAGAVLYSENDSCSKCYSETKPKEKEKKKSGIFKKIKTKSASNEEPLYGSAPMPRLKDALSSLDESFSQMLLRKIDEKGIKDSECYKRANVDRKLFSKIRGDILYKPSKVTAISFAIALELPLNETNELLNKAGFALSHSNKFDVIIEYFITQGIYDIFEINEALFAFDQATLG